MKTYDYKKVRKFIEDNKDNLKSISLGMHEDWFWTAETVWEDGEYKIELTKDTDIAGIKGSIWATPVMHIQFKDGTERIIKCYTGESERDKPLWFDLGPLSGPCQEEREKMVIED